MTLSTEETIKQFFCEEWLGGMLRADRVAEKSGNTYSQAVAAMERLAESDPDYDYIVRRDCPEGHDGVEEDGYCDECGLTYSLDQVSVYRYVHPSPTSAIAPKIIRVSDAAKYIQAVQSVIKVSDQDAIDVAQAVIKASKS